MDLAVRSTGPVLSVAVVVLISLCTQVYFTDVLPAARPALGDGPAMAWTALGLWLVACMAVHYSKVAIGGPGHPPNELSASQRAQLGRDPQLDPAALAEDPAARRYCKHCKQTKPMRTHHCSVCRRCVLKMDHHCPWMNNCTSLSLLLAPSGCVALPRSPARAPRR